MSKMQQRINIWAFIWILFPVSLWAQNTCSMRGRVTDQQGQPLIGASVYFAKEKTGTTAGSDGQFVLNGLRKGRHVVTVSFLGYQSLIDTVAINQNIFRTYKLKLKLNELSEVVVTENTPYGRNAQSVLPLQVVDSKFIRSNLSGSLMQTLSRLPGVSTIDIGSGQSKPVIRGLGFMRVVVAENGIKHEAQEWGNDHGLEIDQFGVERVEVVKGPASLMYGSNAIGGVIDLKQISTPERNSTGGTLLLNTQTNSDLYGGSIKFYKRFNRLYFRSYFTYKDYGDYKIPTDSISYMTYNIRLKDRRLRNSAGYERNGKLVAGWLGKNFSTHLSVSDNFSKSGFFANAHGLEIRTSAIDYDHSAHDIDLPSQQVNHLKVISNTLGKIGNYKWNLDLGYQHNRRKEFSEAVAHGYMPIPPDSLERLYDKRTYTANMKVEMPLWGKHHLVGGANTEQQHNEIGGWGFLFPEFDMQTAGLFLYDNVSVSDAWKLHAGARFDLGKLKTKAYYDWYTTPQSDGSEAYLQRAEQLNRVYRDFSWAVGVVYNQDGLTLKANVGKSFRMPTAKELASNGINYHMYRYEKGDASLKAESSYQLDLGIMIKKEKWYVEVSPFINYFSNYIYLNPTSDYYEAQQIYNFSQSKVYRLGGELLITYDLTPKINLSADAEYIYSEQLSGMKKGYTLPFSPPPVVNLAVDYKFPEWGMLHKPILGIDVKLAAKQNRIVPPEKKTAGYGLLNLRAGSEIKLGALKMELDVQLNNVLDKKYYDHTSYYRLIEVPGVGRNLIVMLQIPFGN